MQAIDGSIREAGANVGNVLLDTKAVKEAYAERVIPGSDVLPSHGSDFPSDASDFIAFSRMRLQILEES
jgi:hypothetical protein